MGRASHLSPEEIAVVRALAHDGKSYAEIARRVNRSATAVRNVLLKTADHKMQDRRGRPRKISPKLVRALRRKGRTGNYTARALRGFFQMDCTVRRVQQLLSTDTRLSWKKMKSKPFLKKCHRDARIGFARTMLKKTTGFWRSVIFSDEKKFNLDGPDSNAYYWADSELDPRYFSRRRCGGGGVMIWGAFSKRGTAALVSIKGKMGSVEYIKTLESSLLPFANEKHPQGWTFQQDNASVQTSMVTKDWFFENNVHVMD